MQIQTVCPQCGKRYTIDEKYEGVEVQCENCGRQFLATRISSKHTAPGRKGRLSALNCILIWLAFFTIQGVGYLLAALINMAIDALLINFMVDASIGFDILKVLITLGLTAAVSYCAFSLVVVKMIARRLKGGSEPCR